MLNLLHHRRQRLRVADGAVSDPSLVPAQPFPYGLELIFGPGLLSFQVPDRGVAGNESAGLRPSAVEGVDLRVLRQSASPVLEPGERGVDGSCRSSKRSCAPRSALMSLSLVSLRIATTLLTAFLGNESGGSEVVAEEPSVALSSWPHRGDCARNTHPARTRRLTTSVLDRATVQSSSDLQSSSDHFVGRKYVQLVLVLGSLMAIGPLTIDTYLPALLS